MLTFSKIKFTVRAALNFSIGGHSKDPCLRSIYWKLYLQSVPMVATSLRIDVCEPHLPYIFSTCCFICKIVCLSSHQVLDHLVSHELTFSGLYLMLLKR